MELKQKPGHCFDAGLSLAPPCGSRFSSSLTTTTTTSSNNSKESNSSLDCSSTTSGGSRGADELDCSSFLGDGKLGLMRKRKRESDALLAGLMRDVELHQSAGPLPTGWQQCLDLQSGEVYYYNPTLQIKTRQDPRKGFSAGLIRNDWNPRRNPQDSQEILRSNSYSQQLQRLEKKRIELSKFVPQFDDDHHLDLSLSLNLFSKQQKQQQQEQQQQKRELSRRISESGLNHCHNLMIPQWMQREILEKRVTTSSDDSSAGSGGMLAACRHCLRFVMLPKSSRNCPCCGQLCDPYKP